MRKLLIYLSKAEWMRRIVMNWKIARKVALRFVAGESLEDAMNIVKKLNNKGLYVTLDQLGEDTYNMEEAANTTNEIIKILEAINAQNVLANISIKLSQLGLGLDRELCFANLENILVIAKKHNIFVRIDMEDSSTVDDTLSFYRKMKTEKGFDNVGLVLQSYLYRSEADLNELIDNNARIRVVKGAYKELPEIAYSKKSDVDTKFDELSEILIREAASKNELLDKPDGVWPPIPAIATHDELRIDNAKKYVDKHALPKNKIEFQMLYGIRRNIQIKLVSEGYPVRVYVPFGTQWYPYFMRRLAERPANLMFFVTSLLRG